LFYIYSIYQLVIMIFGLGFLWMAFDRTGSAPFTRTVIPLAFAVWFLKTAVSGFRFEITQKNWPTIIFGAICCFNAVLIPIISYSSGTGLEPDERLLLLSCGVLGPIFLCGGMFAWRAIYQVEQPDKVEETARKKDAG